MTATTITIVGNLTADPELRFTPKGQAVTTFRVAATERRKNADTGAWEDGDTLFTRVTCWRQLAENTAESLSKGDKVVVTGRLKVREYDDKDNIRRLSVEIDADEVGAALSKNIITVKRLSKPAETDPWTPVNVNEVPF